MDEYRKILTRPKPPVVILSHGISDRHKEQVLALGAQSILTKASVDQAFLNQLKETVAQGVSRK